MGKNCFNEGWRDDMGSEMQPKSFIKNSIFFIILFLVTFYILFKDNDLSDIFSVMKNTNKTYIAIAILCTIIYVLCEAINFWSVLKVFKYKKSFLSVLKYPFVGFFFSSITPSCSGGQPMQLYYMSKDDIKVAHGSMAIFLEFAGFQIATITLALISFAKNIEFITELGAIIKALIIIGIIVNSILLGFMLCVIFSRRVTGIISKIVLWSGKKIRLIKTQRIIKKINALVSEYQEGSVFIRQHKAMMIRIMITTFVQVTALYSVSFWVYKALGGNSTTIFQMIQLQSLLSIAVAGLPLPGGVGANETSFLKIFRIVYPKAIINSALLLTRGISFYIFMAISGLVVLFTQLFQREVRI